MKATTSIKKCILVAALLGTSALALTSFSANANVITFDDAQSNSVLYSPFTSFSDGGLTFTNNGSFAYIWDSSSPNSNGTNNLIFAGFSTGDYLAITRTGGGLFNLNSIDATISWFDNNPSETIQVNGSPITIIQGMQTFSLGLIGVSQVNITGVPSNGGYWAMDNVNMAAVPEPETYGMMLAGLGLVGFISRRRKTA